METSQSWWRNPADAATGRPAGDQTESGSDASGSSGGDDESLGERVDKAIGDFSDRIMNLKEQLEEKQEEIKELEATIDDLEKQQAQAFKELLSSNKHIKKIMAKSTRRRRRSTKTKSKPKTPDRDQDSPLE
jgi:chromosome segregation ATPase